MKLSIEQKEMLKLFMDEYCPYENIAEWSFIGDLFLQAREMNSICFQRRFSKYPGLIDLFNQMLNDNSVLLESFEKLKKRKAKLFKAIETGVDNKRLHRFWRGSVTDFSKKFCAFQKRLCQ